jgi:teichuronic acid exporter
MKSSESILKTGLLWSVIQVLVKRVFDFFVKLVLLNILFPEDFGIVSMATAFTSIIYIIAEFGLKNALVQRKDIHLFDSHYQSVFWLGIAWASFVFLMVFFFGTPLFASFYEEPILLKIIPILTIPVLIESITLVYRAKMLRLLSFKTIAVIQTIAIVLSGFIALIIALKGGQIWSLVIYLLLPFVFSLPLYLFLVPWRPKFEFNIKHLKEIFNFSIFTFFTAFILVVSGNIDYLFIGKLIGAKSLGIYSLAMMLTILVSNQITSMIDRVMFPFYSKVQNDVNLVKNYFLKSLQYYCIILYPIMLGLIVLCSPMIKLFFDRRWLEAKTAIRILAIVVIIKLLTHGCTIVYRSLGKPKLEMFIFLISLVLVTLPAVYLGSFYGITGVATAILVSTVVNSFVSLYFLNKELSITFKDILVKLKAPILGLIITFLIVAPLYLFSTLHFVLLLFILIIVYGSIIYYFHSDKIKYLIRNLLVQ